MHRRGLTHLPRSLAVIDGLRAASGSSIASLDRRIAEWGYDGVDPCRRPRADTRTAYLKGKHPSRTKPHALAFALIWKRLNGHFPAQQRFFSPLLNLARRPGCHESGVSEGRLALPERVGSGAGIKRASAEPATCKRTASTQPCSVGRRPTAPQSFAILFHTSPSSVHVPGST